MAKKKTEEVTDNGGSEILKSLNEKYPGIAFDGEFLKQHTGRKISTGLISLDIALNEGIMEGTITHISGLTKSGKSSLCLTIAAEFQKVGKHVYYIDAEGRLQRALIDCVPGLNPTAPFFNIIRSSMETLLTAEQILGVIETILKDDPGSLIILDSLAALSSETEISGEMADMQRANIPKLMYKFLRKTAPLIHPTKSNLISITHMQANPTGYGSPFREVGGNAIQYFASNWMMCTSSSEIKDKENKSVGKDSKFKMKAVADGAPDAEVIVPIRYGRACCKVTDLFNILTELGVISAAGSWFKIELDSLKTPEGEFPKFQGQEKVCNYLSDPAIFDTCRTYILSVVFPNKS